MGEGTNERHGRVENDNVTAQSPHATASCGGEPYEPIDCTIHDQLIERAAFRLPTQVKYRNEHGAVVVAQDMIEDVYSREGAEYMKLASGTEIRLDKIVDFGGVGSPGGGEVGGNV